jgi:hypothetical protein
VVSLLINDDVVPHDFGPEFGDFSRLFYWR